MNGKLRKHHWKRRITMNCHRKCYLARKSSKKKSVWLFF